MNDQHQAEIDRFLGRIDRLFRREKELRSIYSDYCFRRIEAKFATNKENDADYLRRLDEEKRIIVNSLRRLQEERNTLRLELSWLEIERRIFLNKKPGLFAYTRARIGQFFSRLFS